MAMAQAVASTPGWRAPLRAAAPIPASTAHAAPEPEAAVDRSTARGGAALAVLTALGAAQGHWKGRNARRRRAMVARCAMSSDPMLDKDRMDMPDDEEMDVSGIQFGSKAQRLVAWPPAAAESVDSPVPSFDRWPYYQILIGDLPECDLQDRLNKYMVMDLSDTFLKLLLITNRWQTTNSQRSAGFDRKGIAKLSSAQAAIPAMNRNVQGVHMFRNWLSSQEGAKPTPEAFERFVQEKEADEFAAAELRAMLFGEDGDEARKLNITAVVGTQKGSAVALWDIDPVWKDARVDFLIGEDCLNDGPFAEETLLQLVASKAREQGAERLLSKARFTVEGKLFAPVCFRELGLEQCEGPEEFAEDLGDLAEEVDWTVSMTKEQDEEGWMAALEIPEAVVGLRDWLRVMGLQKQLEKVNNWCEEVGAVELYEVIEEREDLADHLGKDITPKQREMLLAKTS